MTDTDTSAEAVERLIRDLRASEGYNKHEQASAMISTLSSRLAEVGAALNRTEENRDAAMDDAQEEHDRAEAAEAKLAVARDALEPFAATLGRYSGFTKYALFGIWEDVNGAAGRKLNILRKQNFDDARDALAQLDADTPAPKVGECIHMTAEMARNCPTCNPHKDMSDVFATTDAEGMWVKDMEAGVYDEDATKVSVKEAARISDRFHKEQVQIWTQEILEALAMNDLLAIDSYDDKIVASEVVSRELVDIGKSLDTLCMVNRATLRALAGGE